MSYSNYFSIVLLIVLVAFLALIKNRWKYKKGIMFHVSSIAMIPIFLAAAMGLYVGWYGMIHFVWGAVVILGTATIGYEIITKKLQKPLNEMLRAIDALSKGDVDVVIDEKYLKGEHELANIMRRMHKLVGALKNIAAFANHVGKGDLNVEYTLLDEKDSLGKSMLDMRSNLVKAEAEMEKNKREDERRNWVTQGIAKFAGLLRDNNDNIEELCQSIVSNLVKHIGANQAGIFILNDDDAENPILELKACYAYERRKFLQKTIQIGEGLVGACFLERETIYMTNLPKNYINITSGLGEDTPKALLIVPLKVNEAIYGIIEIAAFKAFEPHVREFVEKVSESIASTIGTVKVNMNTNKLLEQTKLQTEEMINQEEELRQNMEEMQATQEEMRRRELELLELMTKMQEAQAINE